MSSPRPVSEPQASPLLNAFWKPSFYTTWYFAVRKCSCSFRSITKHSEVVIPGVGPVLAPPPPPMRLRSTADFDLSTFPNEGFLSLKWDLDSLPLFLLSGDLDEEPPPPPRSRPNKRRFFFSSLSLWLDETPHGLESRIKQISHKNWLSEKQWRCS